MAVQENSSRSTVSEMLCVASQTRHIQSRLNLLSSPVLILCLNSSSHLSMSTCLNAPRCCHVTGWLDVCFIEQFSSVSNEKAGEVIPWESHERREHNNSIKLQRCIVQHAYIKYLIMRRCGCGFKIKITLLIHLKKTNSKIHYVSIHVITDYRIGKINQESRIWNY